MLDIKVLLTKMLTRLNVVAVEHTIVTNMSVSSGSSNNTTKSVTKAGYYPLGVIGWRLVNGSGSGGSYGLPHALRISSASVGSATVAYGFRAVGGNVSNCTLYVTILWQKR